ncbi:hypothetical protein CJF42_24285 [Pseudoalteromonas sp. NBT06-2]|uniref:zonular occludens toxin domain-containing protein n=1 Tax=Pseudoalteromonas sp. NBT06-2 TaxID=2025950 RepID=UPI000BA78AA2|nr:zonular occludens toxin domain-containing protein [Pseudoalteromonas sp. NBT06-2]PAJ71878.1 hypothetical protein CJF42_24285 [Pseudoalteromonas sp. NBT06-2]
MINGIQGKPGGGKSYEAVVSHIIPIISKDKRKVVTNLPLNIDHFCMVFGEYCRDLIEVVDGKFHDFGNDRPFSKKEHFLQYESWKNEKGQKVYFFIDECHLSMPSSGAGNELSEFMSMHRHYGFDIMLITQNFKKVNRDIKDMIQIGYRCIKKSMIGQDDKYILKVHDGASDSSQTVVATHEREYEKRFFSFYQSHTKSNTSVQEAECKDIKKWYDNKFTKLSVVMFIFVLGMLYTAIKSRSEHNLKLNQAAEQPVSIDNETKQVISPNQNEAVKKVETPVYTDEITEKEKAIRERELNERKKRLSAKSEHPYYKVQLHITGWARYTERYSKKHYKLKKDYHIAASQNGQHVFKLGLEDLYLAGYKVSVKSGCMIELWYDDYHDFLTCDSPRINTGNSDSVNSDMIAAN